MMELGICGCREGDCAAGRPAAERSAVPDGGVRSATDVYYVQEQEQGLKAPPAGDVMICGMIQRCRRCRSVQECDAGCSTVKLVASTLSASV